MSGIKHYNVLLQMAQDDLKYFKEIKNHANFFVFKYVRIDRKSHNAVNVMNFSLPSEVSKLSKRVYDRIVNSLNSISAEISFDAPNDPYRRPNYDLIINEFENILALTKNHV
jgi:hypothetical protein